MSNKLIHLLTYLLEMRIQVQHYSGKSASLSDALIWLLLLLMMMMMMTMMMTL